MNSRNRVINTLEYKEVDRIPRHYWVMGSVNMFRREEVLELERRFPGDFKTPPHRYGRSLRSKGQEGIVGEYIDAWGCVWQVGEPGVIGEVKIPPLDDWSDLNRYELPWELLREADLSRVDEFCSKTEFFTRTNTETRPFERMQFIRGTENLMIDLAYGTKEVFKLRDMLHDFFCEEMEMWARTDIDAVSFMDDWGSQSSLLISPSMWREIFKPLYKDYCDILHSRGKYVFMHSDGNIEAIFSDLIEIGVDAINSQLFCMDIEKLGEEYSGKITFWGEIDRQYILPYGTVRDVKNAVRRVANAMLRKKRSGVIAQCEWGSIDPKENIMAIFEEWDKY